MMSIPAIATATRAEEDRVASVLTLAFGTDPVVRWMYSEPLQVLTSFPSFVRAFGGSALDHGSAYCVEGTSARHFGSHRTCTPTKLLSLDCSKAPWQRRSESICLTRSRRWGNTIQPNRIGICH